MFLIKSLFLILICASSLCFVACNSTQNMHTQTVPDADYQQALESTDPKKYIQNASPADKDAMIKRVVALFSDYSKDNLSENVTRVYATDVYFRDAFKQYSSSEDILDYMLTGLKPLHQAEFIFNRVARSGGDYYFDWTMRLDFKKTPPGTWEESIGVSHMRFNSEGKIIFHQDYWDPTDIVYRRIPLVKQLIAFVKNRL